MGQKNSSEQSKKAEIQERQQKDLWKQRNSQTKVSNQARLQTEFHARQEVSTQARQELCQAQAEVQAREKRQALLQSQAREKQQALLQSQAQGQLEAQERKLDQMSSLATASSSDETTDSSSNEMVNYQMGPPGGAPIQLGEINVIECQHSHVHCLMSQKCCICRDQRQQREGYPGYVDGVGMRDEMTRHYLYCPSCKSYLQGLGGHLPVMFG